MREENERSVYSAGFLPTGPQFYQMSLFLYGFNQLLSPIVPSTLEK